MLRAVNLRKLVSSLAIPLAVEFLSWFFTRNSMDVYAELNSPPLAPPGWVFPVVWTILYVLMGLALYEVRMARGGNRIEKTRGYKLFGLQLAFNFLWTILFFRFGLYGFSAIWLGIMIVLIALNTLSFARIVPKAGAMLLPYLLWSLFALYLNIGVFILN